MNLIKEDSDTLTVQCNLCKKEFTLPKCTCTKTIEGYETIEYIRCDNCGEKDKSIVDYKKMLKLYNVTEKKNNLQSFQQEKERNENLQMLKTNDSEQIKCPECGSTQIHADKSGFSVGKAVGGGLLLGNIGLLGGFLGSNKIMISCLKCGHKWKAGKTSF